MKPLVSVLISAYNVVDYVEEAISAVMAQTYTHLEIVIIDDGSSDGTAEILKKLAEQDSRIRIITNEKNLGLIASLNKGLPLLKGEYIARTDSDDKVEPDWIEKLVTFLEKNSDIAACSANFVTFSDKKHAHSLIKWQKDAYTSSYPLTHTDICKAMLHNSPMVNALAVMRRKLISDFGLKYDEHYKHAEDYKFWFEAGKVGNLANLPDVLLHYRMHPMQTGAVKLEAQRNIAKKIRREAVNYYFEQNHIPFRLPEYAPCYSEIAKFAYWISHNINAINDTELVIGLCCELYLSLDAYRFSDLWHFLRHSEKAMFLTKQRNKIIKKFIRTKKYANPFYPNT